MRETVKAGLGRGVHGLDAQCRFERCAFILAHMRCGSTALSNVLCSRPEVSGYGEAHVAYRGEADLGALVVNQARRWAWRPRARYLFDKILHSRHDGAAPPGFFRARAIVLAREPEPAIASIRRLFEGLGKSDYGTDAAAAEYYAERARGAGLASGTAFPPSGGSGSPSRRSRPTRSAPWPGSRGSSSSTRRWPTATAATPPRRAAGAGTRGARPRSTGSRGPTPRGRRGRSTSRRRSGHGQRDAYDRLAERLDEGPR